MSGPCRHMFYGIPHLAGAVLKCVRPEGHEGHHWTSTRIPTARDREWLLYLEGVELAALGMLVGDRRAAGRLQEKGLVRSVYPAKGASYLTATPRGRALLEGEDVR